MKSNISIGLGGENPEVSGQLRAYYQDQGQNYGEITTTATTSTSEIEEEYSGSGSDWYSGHLYEVSNGAVGLDTIREENEDQGSASSFDFHGKSDDVVYVAVGRGGAEDTSKDALEWAVKHAVGPNNTSTVVFLIHVYPEIHFIPTPLGKMPVAQVNTEQKEIYMAQERGKRREFLQRFLKICSSSKVKVDTILIESDLVAKAILDLIPILNIRKLVLGTTKSNLRKIKAKRGSGGIVDQVLQDAPDFCQVKVICEGKEMSSELLMAESPSPSPRTNDQTPRFSQNQVQQKNTENGESIGCGVCFRPKVAS